MNDLELLYQNKPFSYHLVTQSATQYSLDVLEAIEIRVNCGIPICKTFQVESGQKVAFCDIVQQRSAWLDSSNLWQSVK